MVRINVDAAVIALASDVGAFAAAVFVVKSSSEYFGHEAPVLVQHRARARHHRIEFRHRQIPVASESGHWTTEEGDVFIQQQGDLVLVTEGFDAATSQKLRQGALGAINR